MVPEQREALDDLVVKMRAGRMTRRTFMERAVAIGLTSTVAGSLLEACGGGSSSSGPTTVVWQTENDTSGTYSAIVDNYNKTNKDNVHVVWHMVHPTPPRLLPCTIIRCARGVQPLTYLTLMLSGPPSSPPMAGL